MSVTISGDTGVSLAANVSGTVAVANGGTGATSLTANNVILGNGTSAVQAVAPGTSGNVLTSDGTTWTSSALPAGGVTSLNGQTGAVVTTTIGNIGSTMMLIYTANGTATLNSALYVNADTTIAGSSLRYDVGTVAAYTGTSPLVYSQQTNITYAGGGTALSGTWRVMQKSVYFVNNNLGSGQYKCDWSQILMMRIS